MIFGRPPNLVLGAFTAVFNVLVLILTSYGIPLSTELIGGVNIAAAAIIAVIAYTPPTLKPGDTYHLQTGNGDANIERTVEVRSETLSRSARSDDPSV